MSPLYFLRFSFCNQMGENPCFLEPWGSGGGCGAMAHSGGWTHEGSDSGPATGPRQGEMPGT